MVCGKVAVWTLWVGAIPAPIAIRATRPTAVNGVVLRDGLVLSSIRSAAKGSGRTVGAAAGEEEAGAEVPLAVAGRAAVPVVAVEVAVACCCDSIAVTD